MMVRTVLVSVISNLEFGGAQRQLVELTNNLDTDRFEHHVVSLSGYTPLAQHLHDPGVLTVLQKGWKFDFTVVFRLASLLRRLQADIVHGYLFDAEIATRLAGRLAGTPLIVGAERNTDYEIKNRQHAAYRLTRGMMHVCIANSRAGAEFNSRLLGHRPDQYRVIPNGVDIERFRPADRRQARQRLDIPEDTYAVGIIASFKPQKNHVMCLEAVTRARAAGAPVELYLVGDELHGGLGNTTEYKQDMLARIDALGIGAHCHFLGNRSDLQTIYPAFDVTVLTSRFEGTPNVVLESMACGVPVVVTDVSDNRTLVQDGRTGFVVALDDVETFAEKVLLLWQDPTLRAELAASAREDTVRDYATATLARRTENVYLEALDARRNERS